MVRLRTSLVAPVLCAALTQTARGATPLPGERLIEASIGNHGTLSVRYQEADIGRVTVESQLENGSSVTYDWRAIESLVTVTGETGEQTFGASTDAEEYAASLRKMRDLVAYASGPERYEWLVFGADVVAPELNRVIARIDQVLGGQSSLDVNCQLLVASDSRDPLILSGGALGDLGRYSKAVSKVWVKKGYTLVLVSNPLFDTGHDVKLVRVLGSERRTNTELPRAEYDPAFSPLVEGADGSTYTLTGTMLEGAVQSIICRPDLRS